MTYPLDPEPGIVQRTDHKWHVNGDGSLFLLQDDGAQAVHEGKVAAEAAAGEPSYFEPR